MWCTLQEVGNALQEQEALEAQQWDCVKTAMSKAQAAGPSIQPPLLQQLQLQVSPSSGQNAYSCAVKLRVCDPSIPCLCKLLARLQLDCCILCL